MKCLNCKHWKASDYDLTTGTENPKLNDAECEKIKDLIEIDLGCDRWECGGEYVDEIWTNQDFFCAGFNDKKQV